jgi:hypothetical protein
MRLKPHAGTGSLLKQACMIKGRVCGTMGVNPSGPHPEEIVSRRALRMRSLDQSSGWGRLRRTDNIETCEVGWTSAFDEAPHQERFT